MRRIRYSYVVYTAPKGDFESLVKQASKIRGNR